MRTIVIGALLLIAQDSPHFDAASIKPSDPGNAGAQMYSPGPGQFRSLTATLKDLIAYAYGVRPFQVTAGEHWTASDAYDILAKAPGPADNAAIHAMVRALLADRFGLLLAHQTREMALYELTVGKAGAKLTEAKSAGPGVGLNPLFVNGRGADMASLAAALSGRLNRPVVDRTGLTGFYDFRVKLPTSDSDGDWITSALGEIEDQLGLKFVASKGPVEVLVIQSAHRPEN